MDWAFEIKHRKRELIGQIVRRKGYVTEDQVKEALSVQKERGGTIGDILISKGYVTEDQLVSALSSQSGIPFVNLADFIVSENVLLLLEREFVEKHLVFPLYKAENILWVAFADPYNDFVVQEIKNLTGLKIVPVLATRGQILEAMAQHYG